MYLPSRTTLYPFTAILLLGALAGALHAQEPGADDPAPLDKNEADAYRIRTGDLLSVWVYKVEDIQLAQRVTPSGDLVVPLVGSVRAKGRTLDELSDDIRKGLIEKAKMRDPQVTVTIREYAAQQVYILGAVRHARAMDLPIGRPMTLSQSIAVAGGLTGDALIHEIRINRQNDRGARKDLLVDLGQYLSTGEVAKDVTLKPGDTVFIPREGGVFVVGGVERPGFYDRSQSVPSYTRRPLTVSQAIALASGLAKDAMPSQARVIRPREGQASEVISVDLRSVLDGTNVAQDLRLQNGDSVFVPQTDGVYVLGAVNEGGVFYPPHGGTLTVTKALSMAKGFDKFAKRSSVRVVRKGGVTEVDVDKMTDKSSGDLSQDIQLQPGDVVFVPKGF